MEVAAADAEALPFEDARFDLVTSRIAPHHFPDVPQFVREVRRVLKPGGTFALVDNISPDALSTPGFSEAELPTLPPPTTPSRSCATRATAAASASPSGCDVIAAAGLDVLHREILPKAMEFAPWVARMDVDAATTARLRAMLEDGAPALKAFLKPRLEAGALWFSLDEAVVIARKAS